MKSLLSLAFLLLTATAVQAQKGSDIVHSDKPVTWLGLDFTQTRYIGTAMQFRDAGEITFDAVRDKYIPGWNDLFISEPKKFDVPKYVHRESVEFALDVTGKPNNKVSANFFS